jgi:hypothetical protein
MPESRANESRARAEREQRMRERSEKAEKKEAQRAACHSFIAAIAAEQRLSASCRTEAEERAARTA